MALSRMGRGMPGPDSSGVRLIRKEEKKPETKIDLHFRPHNVRAMPRAGPHHVQIVQPFSVRSSNTMPAPVSTIR